MAVAVRMFGHEILDIVVMLKLDVLGLIVLGLGVLRLGVLRLNVLRLGVLWLVVLKLDVLGLDVLGLDVLGLDMLSLLDWVVHCKGAAINFDRREQSKLGALLSVVQVAGQAIGQVDADLLQTISWLQSVVFRSFDEVLHCDSPALVRDLLETASVHGSCISHAAAVAGGDSLGEEIELLCTTQGTDMLPLEHDWVEARRIAGHVQDLSRVFCGCFCQSLLDVAAR